MKVKLLRKLRQESMQLINRYAIQCGPEAWRICDISAPDHPTWSKNLMSFTVSEKTAGYYGQKAITDEFFKKMLRIRVCYLRWYGSANFAEYIRHHFRKYSRKWKSAHGRKLGIRKER